MTTSFPEQLLELRDEVPKMVDYLEKKVPYASALVTQETGFQLLIDTHNEMVAEKVPRRGIVFTLFNGRFFQEWATDCLDVDVLWKKIRDLLKRCQQQPVSEPRFTIEPGEQIEQHYESRFEIDPDSIQLADMVDACHNLIGQIQKLDSKLLRTSIHYQDGKEHKLFVNRHKCLSSTITICNIMLLVVGAKNGSTHLNHIGSGGLSGFEAIQFKKEQLQELIDDLHLLYESKPITPGTYEVLSAPDVSGIVAHEAFGHGVEADMFEKGRAKAEEYLGKNVASPLVSMIDDPSLPGQMGSYFFDDEGKIARPTNIIDQGALKNGLTDLRSATVLGLNRSANGRRESFERKVYARMSNTYFTAGTSTFETMLSSLDKGIYLKKSSSGMEDPKGWGIQVSVNLAREIKNGRLTDNVYAPVTITGYVPDLLKSITQVGDTVGFLGVGGMCGKGHKELVRVSSGGPHLRFQARLG